MNAEVVDILKTIQKVATTPSMAGYDFAAALKEIGRMAERGVELSHREVIPQERLGHVELADPEDLRR